MRAIWYSLPDWSLNPKDFLKQEWKMGFKDKLYSMIHSEAEGSLPDMMARHPAYRGCETLCIFRPDLPLRPLYVGLHNTASKPPLPSIQEVGRRLSLDSADSDSEEEDLNKEIREYFYQPEVHAHPADNKGSYGHWRSSTDSADSGVSHESDRGALTKGMSFLSYLLATPRQSAGPLQRPSIFGDSLRGSLFGDSSRPSSERLSTDSLGAAVKAKEPEVVTPPPLEGKEDSLTPLGAMPTTEEELEQQMQGWDFNTSSTPIRGSPSDLNGSFAIHTKQPFESLLRSATYPAIDDHGGSDELVLSLDYGDSTDDQYRDWRSRRARSFRLEPDVRDQLLGAWKSPNLVSNSATHTPLSPRPPLNRAAQSLSGKGLCLEDEVDEELDLWKVPAEIDHVLEDINEDGLEIIFPDPVPTRSVNKPRPSRQPRRRQRSVVKAAVGTDEEEDEQEFYRDGSEDSVRIGDIVGRGSIDSELSLQSGFSETVELSEEGTTEMNRVQEPATVKPPAAPHCPDMSIEIKSSAFSPFNRRPSTIFLPVDPHAEGARTPPRREIGEVAGVSGPSKKSEFLAVIREGDAYHARLHALNNASLVDEVSPEEASRLLMRSIRRIGELAQPLETLRLLIETFKADVNFRDLRGETGAPPLMQCLDRPDVGRFLIYKGADVFVKDRKGLNAIAATVPKNEYWVLEEFADSDQETALFSDPDETKLKEYVAWLVFAGYGTKLKRHIHNGDVTVTAAQAAILFSQCSENFGNMREPVETYELLEKLMSSAL
jgi:hypothetical protein